MSLTRTVPCALVVVRRPRGSGPFFLQNRPGYPYYSPEWLHHLGPGLILACFSNKTRLLHSVFGEPVVASAGGVCYPRSFFLQKLSSFQYFRMRPELLPRWSLDPAEPLPPPSPRTIRPLPMIGCRLHACGGGVIRTGVSFDALLSLRRKLTPPSCPARQN